MPCSPYSADTSPLSTAFPILPRIQRLVTAILRYPSLLLLLLAAYTSVLPAQPVYDLLLKGGHVIDPANEIDRISDLAITGDQIAVVADNIPPAKAKQVVDVSGLYVTPGLIDIHAHVFGLPGSLFPDDTSLVTGATTIVDCSGSGWRTFDRFKSEIIDRVQTRVLAYLNIVGAGMVSSAAESNTDDMDAEAAAAKVHEYPNLIVGIKKHDPGPTGFFVFKRAIETGKLADVPVLVDDNIYTNQDRNMQDKLLDIMRPGDLHTHMYNDQQMHLVSRFGGDIRPVAWEARRRGVLFDLGHGGSSFMWPVAAKAIEHGFPHDVISTDLHSGSVMNQVDMPNCISKLMNLGMGLNEAIARSTVNPSRAICKFPELGTLGRGKGADIAVFDLEKGVFAFMDARRNKLLGKERLYCVLTVRGGKIVFDENGLSFLSWDKQ